MPRFSANLSMLFTELALLDRFEAARRAGFEQVEIQFPYDRSISELRAAMRDAGVALVLLNVPAADLLSGGDGLACVPGSERAFAEALALACEYGAALGVRCVNVLAGRVPTGVEPSVCRETLVANLRLASSRLHEHGIVPVVEALNGHDHPRFALQRHDDVLALLDEVGSDALRVQYDVYHQHRMGRDVLADLRRDLERVGHVQIADVPGRGTPGSGEFPFAALFEQLDEGGYDGFVGAEYRPEGPTEASLGWFVTHRPALRRPTGESV